MPYVLCTRPNASDNINGFPFVPHPGGGMVSADDLPEDVVANFLAIPGYSRVAPAGGSAPEPVAAPSPQKPAKSK